MKKNHVYEVSRDSRMHVDTRVKTPILHIVFVSTLNDTHSNCNARALINITITFFYTTRVQYNISYCMRVLHNSIIQ
jgi:hypothetical protein